MSLSAVPEQYRSLRSFAFGDGPEPADRLLELVLQWPQDRDLLDRG